MARDGAAWGCAAALALTACGGQSFVFASDSDASITVQDAATPADAAPAEQVIPCPGTGTCPVDGGTCCTGTSATTDNCTMGNGACGCSNTSLKCARDSNCPGSAPCCIGSQTLPGCQSPSFVSTCRPLLGACLPSEVRLCNPNASSSCPVKFACSSNASDLQQWGLPAGTSDYGVCVSN